MKGKLHILLLLMIWIMTFSSVVRAGDRWQSGFDTTGTMSDEIDSVLTLGEVLDLVATQNPTLRSIGYMQKSAQGRLQQAGLWKNPEFSTEFEEVGWDAPGLRESEISIALSQEFELFGQRKARKQVALTDIESTNFEMKLSAFDLYLETKKRFNSLLYSQKRVALADSSVNLAKDIVKNIEYRMKEGIALQSEFLLAQLELQRADLASKGALQELFSAQVALAALWNSKLANITVIAANELDLRDAINKLPKLAQNIDSSRFVRQLHHKKMMTRAEMKLASAESKPGITVSGGFKRLEFDNSNSFLFGISLPLPIFNRNQGKTASLEAEIRSQEYDQERTRLETRANINSTISRLDQLISQHITLDTLLLPTAENAYKSLQEAYNVGRIPYTSLLEAERSLIQLKFERNDVLFATYEQLILLERVSGIRLY